MDGRSQPPTGQISARPDEVIRRTTRHLSAPLRYTPSPVFAAAVERLWVRAGQRPIVVDGGCGVGLSTVELAERHPGAFVIGIDRSVARLRRRSDRCPDNCAFVVGNLIDLGLLSVTDRRLWAKLYLLYPNPYPKPGDLRRRLYGHGGFPALVRVAQAIEMRTNWRVYAEEFAVAVHTVIGQAGVVETWTPPRPLSGFERKYLASEHPLWRYRLDRASPR